MSNTMSEQSKEKINGEMIIPEAEPNYTPVPMQPGGFLPADPGKYLEEMENALDFQKRFHLILLKTANPETDLVAIGGRGKEIICPTKSCRFKWMQLAGGQLVFPRDHNGDPRLRRISLKDSKGGEYYGYEAYATFVRKDGRCFDGSALITSRHKFFGKESVYEDGHKVGSRLKEQEDVEEESVRQAAISYAQSRAIDAGLGITKVTVSQLQEAGIDVGKISGYTFSGSSGKSGSSSGSSGKKAPERLIDSETKTKILEFCKENNITDKELLRVLGGMGYERLPQLKHKDLKKLRDELNDLVSEKIA